MTDPRSDWLQAPGTQGAAAGGGAPSDVHHRLLPIQGTDLTVRADRSGPEPDATTTRLGTGLPFSLRGTACLRPARLRPASAMALRTCFAPCAYRKDCCSRTPSRDVEAAAAA